MSNDLNLVIDAAVSAGKKILLVLSIFVPIKLEKIYFSEFSNLDMWSIGLLDEFNMNFL